MIHKGGKETGDLPVTLISNEVPRGRPLIQVKINEVMLTCFIDTGSEITLLKDTVRRKVNLKSAVPSFRAMRGATGHSFRSIEKANVFFDIGKGIKSTHVVEVVGENISFPGDVLLGVDFLRRFNFKLTAYHSPYRNYVTFNGVKLDVQYSDSPSVGVQAFVGAVQTFRPRACTDILALVVHTIVCPPNSGRYVECLVARPFSDTQAAVSGCTAQVLVPYGVSDVEDSRVNIWVVNDRSHPVIIQQGMCLAHLDYIGEVLAPTDTAAQNKGPSTVDNESDPHVAVIMTPGLPIEEEIEADEFDEMYGITDFGYSNDEFMVFPPVNTDVCSIGNVVRQESSIPAADLEHLGSVRRQQLLDVIGRYPNLFDEETPLGCLPDIKHSIRTKDAQPIRTRQWRLPESARTTIRKECDQMLKDGIIEPSNSPWLSPVVLVKKKDGGIRFCVDYRNLNKITIVDTYPMPRLDQSLDDLSGKLWFTALDARSAYWTIEVEPRDRPKTAFSDGYRLFQFRRMPFGLATAPSTFQRAINTVLNPVLGHHALAYLDDVVIYSHNFEEHLAHLDETLHLLARSGFKLNISKCQFAKNEFKFLGFLVTPEGILPDPSKVEAISKMTPPRTVRQVRQFLGATGFFRRHIEHYATVAAPLTKLLRKSEKFQWGPDQQVAFQKLIAHLTAAPVLRKPDFQRRFEVHTDASSVAIGACLLQRDDKGRPQAVAYFSRKLRDSEKAFAPIDFEALAVVEAVRHFDPYLYGRPFDIFTDHQPLVGVFKKPTRSPRMTRWGHELALYNYDLKYKPGAVNRVPDLLSRKINLIDDPLSPQVVANAQGEDPLWREIIAYLRERRPPRRRLPLPLEEFEMRDGLLYHTRLLNGRILQQLVIPRALREEALKQAHGSEDAAHPGIFRTYCKLRDQYYFPQMLATVRKYVASCQACQRRKGVAGRAPLAALPEVTQPLERVSADLIDMAGSSSGHRYLLVIIDHYTRYLQLIPLFSKEANNVADAFIEHFVTLFGPPRTILTDNGLEFANRLFRQVCEVLKVKTKYVTRYHPQANGMVERANRVVKDALSILAEQHPDDWVKLIPHVRLALNTAVHRSINETPLYLLLGRDNYFPTALTNFQEADEDAARLLQGQLREARETAVQTSRNTRERWTQDYNRRARGRFKPEVGDLVLIRVFHPEMRRHRSRLGPRWRGPVRVLKQIGPVTYIVRDPISAHKELRCHVNQLRKYIVREEFEFMRPPVENNPNDVAEDPQKSARRLLPAPSGRERLGGARRPLDFTTIRAIGFRW